MTTSPLKTILATAIASAVVFIPLGYASAQIGAQTPEPEIITETIIQEPMPEDWNALPDCEQEDQTAPDCKWDAGSAGNGEGYSFYVRNGEYHYVIG